jgi:hypothetical protein
MMHLSGNSRQIEHVMRITENAVQNGNTGIQPQFGSFPDGYPKRLSARDRRLAAVHEAGHFTMGHHVGLHAISAWLEEIRLPKDYDKLWIGHTRYLLPPTSKRKLSHRKIVMFAVSGAIAECCWRREAFDEDMWFDPDAMSASDWAGCGCEPGEPSSKILNIIEYVFSLIDRESGELWPAVAIQARLLIDNSRDSVDRCPI